LSSGVVMANRGPIINDCAFERGQLSAIPGSKNPLLSSQVTALFYPLHLPPPRLLEISNHRAQPLFRKPPSALGKTVNKAHAEHLVEFERLCIITEAIREQR
jgi:hypothetical protein